MSPDSDVASGDAPNSPKREAPQGRGTARVTAPAAPPAPAPEEDFDPDEIVTGIFWGILEVGFGFLLFHP